MLDRPSLVPGQDKRCAGAAVQGGAWLCTAYDRGNAIPCLVSAMLSFAAV